MADFSPSELPRMRVVDGTGEGIVRFPDRWRQLDSLTRADLLKDWLYDIQNAYREAVKELNADLKAMCDEAAAKRAAQNGDPK